MQYVTLSKMAWVRDFVPKKTHVLLDPERDKVIQFLFTNLTVDNTSYLTVAMTGRNPN